MKWEHYSRSGKKKKKKKKRPRKVKGNRRKGNVSKTERPSTELMTLYV